VTADATPATLLTARLHAALRVAFPEVDPAPFAVVAAADPRFGDYQANAAMALAKQAKANPRDVANRLIDALDTGDLADPPTVAGAGFINFTLRPEFLAARLAALARDPALSVPATPSPRTVVIDFSSPNVAKPMHVGHIRSTILGDALARIARRVGHRVVTDNHLGDWGTQFGKVIWGWKNLRDDGALQREPIAELVRLYKEANARATEDPATLAACRDELVRLQAGDPDNLAIWKRCVELSWGEFDAIYQLLDVTFDERLGESFYNDRLGPLCQRLEQEGVATTSEGALCVFFPDTPQLADKPCLVRKSDGGFNYATTDLATLEYRIERWNADAIWYVVGAPQQLHLQQVFAVAQRLGIQRDLRHVAFGSILGDDRKLMKTRSGENVALRDLLAEAEDRALKIVTEKSPDLPAPERAAIARAVGIGAVKYADLSQHRLSDYVFSFEKMLSFQGNTAPYLQNAHVRIRSIFRKLDAPFAPPASPPLESEAERKLALGILQFGEVVTAVLDDFRPNLLANHLHALATTFHAFYEACPVLKADGATRDARLLLCELTARTLKEGLALLGIEAPERM
jgi:arginyl-tRNA synthetase